MELLLLFLIVFFTAGGGAWLGRRYFGARQFLADHPTAYKGAGALSFLTTVALATAAYFDDRDPRRISTAGSVAILLVTALVLIPVWFVVILVAAFLYRNLVAPVVEIFVAVAGFVAFLAAPLRRRPVPVDDTKARADRDRREQEEAAAGKRREDARAACEILYALHAPEINARFPRGDFDRFVQRFLTDDRSPEEVERKAAELQLLIRQHAEKVAGGKTETLAGVQAWYAEQLRELAAVPDGPMKESFQAVLLQEYNDRMTRAMGARP